MTKFLIKIRYLYIFIKSKFLKKKIQKNNLILSNFKQIIKNYKFKSFWFFNNINIFDYYLPDNLNKKFKYLEIGSYEGLSLMYVLSKYKRANVTAIDIINILDKKIKKKFKNYQFIKSDSILALRKLLLKKKYFDFIYVDGLHNGEHVIVDAIESFKLLKKGGKIMFDDFMSEDKNLNYQTREGLFYFLLFFKREIKILYFQNVLVIEKK